MKRNLCFVLFVFLLLPGLVMAGQTIVIDGQTIDPVDDVAGNGDATNYGKSVGLPTLDANNNSLIVTDSDLGRVYGGYSNFGTANSNSVSITNSVADDIYGGRSNSTTGDAIASNNNVSITDSVTDYIYGGYSESTTGDAIASNNSITINGGIVTGDIIGGVADGNTKASATNNTITISGDADLTGSSLYGGDTISSTSDVFSGNTLNILSPIEVENIANFEYINFVLPSTNFEGFLRVNDAISLSNGIDKYSTITVNTVGEKASEKGDNVQLIAATSTSDFGNYQPQAEGKHGAMLNYIWDLEFTTDFTVTATLADVEADPRVKALSEGFLGGVAMLNQALDLLTMRGTTNATGDLNSNGLRQFGAISGGTSHYNTGSSIDLDSFSLLGGFAYGADTSAGHTTLGAFMEFGTGSYDTHNSFANAAPVNGDGDARYIGGGILGRVDFLSTGASRFYSEASARLGSISNDYSTSDLRDGAGQSVGGYDSSSIYYGLHFGTGFIHNISDAASLELYGKYLWTRMQGDSVTLKTGDNVKFEDADSHRLRAGARFTYVMNEIVTPFAGVAYEHEFDGEANASTYGYEMDAPSLGGDTGIGELGVTVKPSVGMPLSIDVAMQGYTGKREGVGGNLQVKAVF